MFQLLRVPDIDRIFYFFKRSEAFEIANITNLHTFLIFKRPYNYLQIVDLETCPTYNLLKFYVQFLLSFVYPYILKSRSFSRCHTNKSGPKHASLVLFDWFHIHRLCITGKLSDVQCFFFFKLCTFNILTRNFIETKHVSATNHPYIQLWNH